MTPVQVEGQETGTPALHVPTRMAVNVERREWTAADKVNHSDACKNKGRLTLAEKLQIIHLYQEVPVHERKKQKDLAVMFCKSRMTICKVLRKESVDKIKALAATGICLRAKRSRIVRYPKFEQSLLEQLGPNGTRLLTRRELLVKARALSNAMNIADLTMDYKWCSRFMKHYGLAIHQQHRKGKQKGSLTAVDVDWRPVHVNTKPTHNTMATTPMCPPSPQGGRLGLQPSPACARVAGRAMDKAAKVELCSPPVMCESDQTIPATHDDAIALLNSIRHLRQYVLQPADSSASISLLQAPETHSIFEPFSRACSLGIWHIRGVGAEGLTGVGSMGFRGKR